MENYAADQLERDEDAYSRLEMHLAAYSQNSDRVRFVRLLPPAWDSTPTDTLREDL